MAENKENRNFGLSSFAVDNATSILLLTAMILLFGLKSYIDLPKESFPEIPWPKVYINTLHFGNSPADIESLVTRHIEKELSSISGIKNIKSNSLQDYSIIEAEFNADIKMSDAVVKVKDAVDKAKSELPNDLTREPEVLEINMSEIPIMTVNVSGNYPNDVLRKYAEFLEDKIKDLKEISDVDMKGDLEREVSVNVDIGAMQARKVSYTDIENAIRSENLTMSGGEMIQNNTRRTIRVVGEFEEVREMESLIIKSEFGSPVYLRDVAKVVYGFKEQTSIARADGLPVISLDVIKRAGENLLIASDTIKGVVRDVQATYFPEDVQVSIFNDQSIQTRNMVSNLENSIISGIILVILVLLFFLGLRNAMFVGLAIPLSMLLGIMILGLLGYTMNMVVLFSLILALGMLVDNAIVIVENIYRYHSEGYSLMESAKLGASEVAIAIIASTATTLAAFLPLAFWPGLMGSFMKFLPITLICVLTSSLFVALVINPVIASRFMKIEDENAGENFSKRKLKNFFILLLILAIIGIYGQFSDKDWLRNLMIISIVLSTVNYFVFNPLSSMFQSNFLPILENAYNKFIRFSLKGIVPYIFMVGTVFLLFFSLVLLGGNMPKIEFFPKADPLYVNAFVEMPIGTDIQKTNEVMLQLEKQVAKIIKPYEGIVGAFLAQIGENTADPNAGPSFGASPHRARLTISFVPSEERGELSSKQAMDDIRSQLQAIPGVKVVIDQNADGPPQEKPINLELKGEDINLLAVLSDNVIAHINRKEISGIEELKADIAIGKPEMLVKIDREAARRYGLSTYAIADALRTSVFGKEVSKFKDGEDDYDIVIRSNENYKNNKDGLMNQQITFRDMATGQIMQVPIATVASIEYGSTFNSINRKDQERMITIQSNVLSNFNPNEVVAEVKTSLDDFDMPEGVTYKFTGQQEQMAEEMAFLTEAFIVALFVIFIILVAQFNSIVSPFIIIVSVLFSTIGVFLGYVFSGMNIVVIMTGVGIVSLAGIVVNNAIVLIDYTNLLVERKRNSLGVASSTKMEISDVRDAIINGGATRLRPVLLTAITTILGLVPLAIGFNFNFFTFVTDFDPQLFIGGDNAAFWGTMAWTVVYGLIFSTFLTLVIIPVMYWLSYLGVRRISFWFGK